MGSKKSSLPPDRVVIKNGKVVLLEEWTDFNLDPVKTFIATFDNETGEFSAMNNDPEHGGSLPVRGKKVDEVMNKILHPDIASKLVNLFKLENPTEEEIRSLLNGNEERLQVDFQ